MMEMGSAVSWTMNCQFSSKVKFLRINEFFYLPLYSKLPWFFSVEGTCYVDFLVTHYRNGINIVLNWNERLVKITRTYQLGTTSIVPWVPIPERRVDYWEWKEWARRCLQGCREWREGSTTVTYISVRLSTRPVNSDFIIKRYILKLLNSSKDYHKIHEISEKNHKNMRWKIGKREKANLNQKSDKQLRLMLAPVWTRHSRVHQDTHNSEWSKTN